MKLVNASFRSRTLAIVDTLYRHTLGINHPNTNIEALHDISLSAGEDWLKRNAAAYLQLTIPYKIIRWDTYLANVDFQKHYKIIDELYHSDIEFRAAINVNVEEYLHRYANRIDESSFDYEQSFAFCVNYLKEECAGMCLWPAEQYEFEVYPTGRCPVMVSTYLKLIEPLYPTLLRPVGIRYKR